MKPDVKITIIVPVYNVEKYLNRCVESLTKQTLQDIEIILVDDGSTDQSGVMCDKYAAEDERIRTFHKDNAGQGLARNLGIEQAAGTYICFLDSDDYVEKNMCEELFKLMESTGADMCTYGYQIDAPDGTCVRKPHIEAREYVGKQIKEEFSLHFYGDDPADDNLRGYSSCMSVFRQSIIRHNNLEFLSERKVLSEDNLFCLNALRYISKVVTTSTIYYHYCQKADSFSQGYSEVRMPMTKELIGRFREYAYEYGVSERAEIRIAGLVWINLMSTIKQDVRRISDSTPGASGFAGEGITKKQVLADIEELCRDMGIYNEVIRLRHASLPLQQKMFLEAYLHRWVKVIYLMADIRSRRRI